jgi:hypothetical protein
LYADESHLPIEHIIAVKNGQRPTKYRAEPAENKEEGRGSLVWFNQASSFQTAKLLYSTIKENLAHGEDVNFDYTSAVRGGHPFVPISKE